MILCLQVRSPRTFAVGLARAGIFCTWPGEIEMNLQLHRLLQSRCSKGEQRAYAAVTELFDKDPQNREIVHEAFYNTVIKKRPDVGSVFFGTLDLHTQAQVRQVCAPHYVVIG